MLGYWLIWIAAGVVLGLLAFFVGQPKFSRWYHQKRRKLRKRAWSMTLGAWQSRGHSTARGRLRQQRRREPLRLTFGHRRRPDDPTLGRRAARKAAEAGKGGVERARLAWLNRTPLSERVERRRASQTRDMGPQMMCGSTRTDNGHPCRNPRMLGKDHCQVHPTAFGSWFSGNGDGLSWSERRRIEREQRQEREQNEQIERELSESRQGESVDAGAGVDDR